MIFLGEIRLNIGISLALAKLKTIRTRLKPLVTRSPKSESKVVIGVFKPKILLLSQQRNARKKS